jgi:hypothetical protein
MLECSRPLAETGRWRACHFHRGSSVRRCPIGLALPARHPFGGVRREGRLQGDYQAREVRSDGSACRAGVRSSGMLGCRGGLGPSMLIFVPGIIGAQRRELVVGSKNAAPLRIAPSLFASSFERHIDRLKDGRSTVSMASLAPPTRTSSRTGRRGPWPGRSRLSPDQAHPQLPVMTASFKATTTFVWPNA